MFPKNMKVQNESCRVHDIDTAAPFCVEDAFQLARQDAAAMGAVQDWPGRLILVDSLWICDPGVPPKRNKRPSSNSL